MALSFRDLSHLLMGTGLQWAGRDDSSLFARAEMALHTNSPVTSEENQTIGPVSVDGRRSAERRCQGRTKQDPCIGSKFRRGKKKESWQRAHMYAINGAGRLWLEASSWTTLRRAWLRINGHRNSRPRSQTEPRIFQHSRPFCLAVWSCRHLKPFILFCV